MLNDETSEAYSGFALEKEMKKKGFINFSFCMPFGCVLYKASLKKDLNKY